MRARLRSGHEVIAFKDFHNASAAGMLSRSSWRNSGRIVPEETVPCGIVIRKHGKVRKKDGPWFEPILCDGDDGEYQQLVVDWFEVFSQDQTFPKQSQNLLIPTVSSPILREGGGDGSLMTPKESEETVKTRLTTNGDKTDRQSVNNVRAYVPEGLSLPDNCRVKEQIWWFLGLLYWKHLEGRLPWEEPIHLKYDYLKENIPQWSTVWQWCEAHRIVERIGGYTPGLKSYPYRTAAPYRDQTHRLKTFGHKVLAKRQRTIEAKHFSRPILKRLRDQLDRLTVDMDLFNERFGKHPDRRYYLAHLHTICDKELRFTKDDFSGRIHTNITNLYKPLRALLRVDNERDCLGEIDIKNSQLLFLGLAAKSQGVEDLRFLQLCEAGEIYEHFAQKLCVVREAAKHELMVALFSKNRYRSATKRILEIEFPAISQFIHKIKEKDHTRLARHMQEAERRYIIDTVCVRLFREKSVMFLTTIHDALLTQKSDCNFVLEIMKDEFTRLGVNPRLEWTDLGGTAF